MIIMIDHEEENREQVYVTLSAYYYWLTCLQDELDLLKECKGSEENDRITSNVK